MPKGRRAFAKSMQHIVIKLRQPLLKLAVLTQADSDCILNFVSDASYRELFPVF